MTTTMKQRGAYWALLLGTGAMLSGCVYDPYTGGYYPCCNGYPYQQPYNRYPQYPYPPPAYYPQPGQPMSGQPMEGQPVPQPRSEAPTAPRAGNLAQRFAAANVTQDGRLTRDQAQAAGWRFVASNFPAMDSGQKGYVTLDDIRSWAVAHRRVPGGAPERPVG